MKEDGVVLILADQPTHLNETNHFKCHLKWDWNQVVKQNYKSDEVDSEVENAQI